MQSREVGVAWDDQGPSSNNYATRHAVAPAGSGRIFAVYGFHALGPRLRSGRSVRSSDSSAGLPALVFPCTLESPIAGSLIAAHAQNQRGTFISPVNSWGCCHSRMASVTMPRHRFARLGQDVDMLFSQFARVISISALCAVVVGCAPSTGTAPSTTTTTTTSQTAPFTLNGKVLQAGTSNGITSASVTLTPASSSPLTTTTDATGAFSFSGLATSGTYTLQVAASGYVPVTTAITIPVTSFTINLSVATTPQPVPVLTVSGQASFTAVGQTSQLTAILTNTDGTTSDVTTVAKWSSSNTAVAQVSSSGLVTALGKGATVISATLTNASGGIGVTVSF